MACGFATLGFIWRYAMSPTRRFVRPLLGLTRAYGRSAHGGIIGAKTAEESFSRTPGPPVAAIEEIALVASLPGPDEVGAQEEGAAC
jgi:hypothetical protein